MAACDDRRELEVESRGLPSATIAMICGANLPDASARRAMPPPDRSEPDPAATVLLY